MAEALRRISFSDMPGWAADDHAAALQAFQRSAAEMLSQGHGFKRQAAFGGMREEWQTLCAAALRADDARSFFEQAFVPLRVTDPVRPHGLFTGYYEPLAEGALTQSDAYPVPLYAKPDDLVAFSAEEAKSTGLSYGQRFGNKPTPYPARREIESGALAGRGLEICFLKSWVDAFFIHIQGSGRIKLSGGATLRLSYAAKNGRAYTSIGAVLLAKGIGTPETMSMQFLRNWMQDHPNNARDLLWHNDSFVFFRATAIEDESLGAIGAAKVNLTPQRSLAIDRSYWMFGTPLFVETHAPPEAGGAAFQHLMIAQDTGTAIRGLARGDVYWGWGEAAAFSAGHMKSPGSLVALLPKVLAERLKA